MLAFVPVAFSAYRQIKTRLWPVMQALVAHADRDGRCYPSLNTLSGAIGAPRSSVGRWLHELARAGVIARQRSPGGVYRYVIDKAFLPDARHRAGVSQRRDPAVPKARTEENPLKKTDRADARFAKSGVSYGELPDEHAKWQARLRSWRKSRFWLPLWGARPGSPGCMVPPALLMPAQRGKVAVS